MFKQSILALSVVTALSACTIEINDDKNEEKNASTDLNIQLIGRAVLNSQSPEGAAEIVAFQASTNYIYAVNSSSSTPTVEVLDASNINPSELAVDSEGVVTGNTGSGVNLPSVMTIDLLANTAGDANSIAVSDSAELLAVAIAADATGTKGNIAFYDISGGNVSFIKNVEVGYLPDMVEFNHDGTQVVVANEGEPSGDYSIDPEGSISIIDITAGMPADTATNLDFNAFDNQKTVLETAGVKFANPGMSAGAAITVSQDLEPEYVAISEDNKTAFVSMQENNAIAIVDLTTKSITAVKPLGFKNWGMHEIDVSNKDGVNFTTYSNLYGMYQPDTIATYQVDGKNYFVTANEGDAREYIDDALSGGTVEDENKAACETKHPNGLYEFDDEEICFSYLEEIRIKDLDDMAPLSTDLQSMFDSNGGKDGLGRLKVSHALGYSTSANEYQSLYAFGARSFSIFDEMGNLVFDSGDQIEKLTYQFHQDAFNNNEDENEGDSRSDDKGPEPESVAIGKVGNNTYAFIGLERMGGIFVYNINNPYDAKYVDYFINRGLVEGADITGDLAPEGMKFVAADKSPTGEALLIIGNEISGSVAVWQIED
ncbi:choice-of-anchor I family protein [Catenovulum maritimum]|uniref:Alkaline phosphatase n=1 Tax=Catenovulum maritimum TaxID=1513271 RepID=A0A0J8GV23_9ALTE|nr:choice-of-anchor I family protein [Catenovulum maritimum]KMT65154.1 alkaline phosphatase [Catenovulum maritimum]